ncbi:MAG: effector binding domain-containing protein [Saprospiraceae bacterium]|nr:effector binding domain-containing protein [Saprospiraceae bacterium]
MEVIQFKTVHLIGLTLKANESNQDDISRQAYGQLWQTFEDSDFYDIIPNKIGNEILAVYHSYDEEFEGSFQYFVGCKVIQGTEVPDGLESLEIPSGMYAKFTVHGEIPECTTTAWKSIGGAVPDRTYIVDFEVYDERSADRDNAIIDIFLSVNK